MNENPEELMIKEEMLLNIFKHFTDYEIEILLGNATTEEVAEERGVSAQWIKRCINAKRKNLTKETNNG